MFKLYVATEGLMYIRDVKREEKICPYKSKKSRLIRHIDDNHGPHGSGVECQQKLIKIS